MNIKPINSSQNNTTSFGARIILNNPELKDSLRGVEDTKWAKDILDRFLAHEPKQTVEISYKKYSSLIAIEAKNLNTGATQRTSYDVKENMGTAFCKFLDALLDNTFNASFWKNAKPTADDLMAHDVFICRDMV